MRQVLSKCSAAKSKGQVLINCVCNCHCPTHTCSTSGAKTNALKETRRPQRLSVISSGEYAGQGRSDQECASSHPNASNTISVQSGLNLWPWPISVIVAYAFLNIWHIFKLMRGVFTHLSHFRRREKSFQCHYSLPSYFELWSVLYLSKEIFICISCHAGISCKICWWQCPKVHETYSTKKYETPFSNLESDFPSKEIRNY